MSVKLLGTTAGIVAGMMICGVVGAAAMAKNSKKSKMRRVVRRAENTFDALGSMFQGMASIVH